MAQLDEDEDAAPMAALAEDVGKYDMTNVDMDFDCVLSGSEDEMAQQILSQVSDLGKYMKEVEAELDQVEHESVPEYVKEAERFAELYNEIGSCDKILEAFETLLSSFQDELLSINSDIKALQDASVSSNAKIGNRKEVIKVLDHYAKNFAIPRELIKAIARNDINTYYVNYIEALNKKIAFFEAQNGRARACRDVEVRLGTIAQTAIQRTVTHLTRLLSSISDVGALQRAQAEMSQLGALYQFLYKYDPDVGGEQVRTQYVEVASRAWFLYCKAEATALIKYQAEVARKGDTLGAPEAKQSALGSLFGGESSRKKLAAQKSMGAFAVGTRVRALLDAESGQPAVQPPRDKEAAEQAPLYFESVWRSMLVTLGDLAACEAAFSRDFFLSGDNGALVVQRVAPLFAELLGSTMSSTYDTVGVALVVRLTEMALARGANAPGFTYVEPHLKEFLKTASSTLERLLVVQTETVQNATPKSLGVPASTSAHYVTRRYVELLISLLTVTAKSGPDIIDMVNRGQKAMSKQMEKLLMRLAETIASTEQRTLFLLNNYDLVNQLLRTKSVGRPEDVQRWRELLDTAMHNFIDQQLLSVACFASLVRFVTPLRQALEDPATSAAVMSQVSRESVEAALREFSQGWKRGIEQVQQAVMSGFSDLSTGTGALKAIIEQVYLYYKDLTAIVKASFKELRHNQYFVSETEILHEMRKIGDMLPAPAAPLPLPKAQ
eukprot:m51a1_g8756 hypothetical protein (723) ;mRNA; f:104092-107233